MPPIALSLQTYDAFSGTQEGVHSIILPDIFSSGGSKNVYMDKFARVKRILGYSAQGNAVTTNTGGSATLIRAYFPYRKTSGGSLTRQLIGVFDDGTDEWELWYSTDEGTSWTFIGDLGATSVGKIPDFEQFGDTLIIVNGVITARTWNGTTFAVAGATQLAAPTYGATATGNLLGNYQWKVVPVKNDGTRKPGSVASASVSLQRKSQIVNWTADADTDVVGYELYRPTGTGSVFYFVDYVNGRTTVTFTDNIEDLVILENRVCEEHGDAPPTGARIVVAHKQTVWYAGFDSFPQRAYRSDTGDFDSVLADNYLEYTDAEAQGDFITAGVGNFEGMLVWFQERSIWTTSGTGQIIGNIPDLSRSRTNAQIGAVSQRSVIRIPAGATYYDQEGQKQRTSTVTLAYLTPNKDIRLFDGDNDIIISYPVVTTLSGLNYTQRHKVHTLHDTTRNHITWFFPHSSNTECSSAVTWNYKWGVWYLWELPFNAAVEIETSTDNAVHLGGSASLSTGGKTFELWDTNTFAGTAFSAYWMTKTLYGQNDQGQPIPSFVKRHRWLDLLFETDQSATINVSWFEGGAADTASPVETVTVSPTTASILTANGDTIVTIDGDTIVVGAATSTLRVRINANGQYFHDKGIRLRIGDVASVASWSLEGFIHAYQILPGLARTRAEN